LIFVDAVVGSSLSLIFLSLNFVDEWILPGPYLFESNPSSSLGVGLASEASSSLNSH
jgi:hypothetical protein